MRTRATVLLVLAAMVGACGAQPNRVALPAAQGGSFQAAATKTLQDGFKHIHLAGFSRLDVNTDNHIDEYEAGSFMELKDFARADKNRNGKLTKKEFMDFATAGSVFGFVRQNKNAFMKQTRDVLWRAFQRLDANRDRHLKPVELSDKALAKVGIHLRIDGLRLRVVLNELDDTVFETADKTGDGQLSQAEFEDYCIGAFIKGINPNYAYGTTPPPPAEPTDPAEPADPGTPGDDEDSW